MPGAVTEDGESAIEHIHEAQTTKLLIVAPATADTLAKFAHGLADDFLSTMYLATTAPVVVAPAMNVVMWEHPATQANVETLRSRGVKVIEPGSGYLACGMVGGGRLAEPAAIVAAVAEILRDVSVSAGETTGDGAGVGDSESGDETAAVLDFAGETVLVTAGGTREAIDPVRFIGNRSSGRMGYAVAEAARRRGARVILMTAPTGLACPAGVEVVQVVSAEEMRLGGDEAAARGDDRGDGGCGERLSGEERGGAEDQARVGACGAAGAGGDAGHFARGGGAEGGGDDRGWVCGGDPGCVGQWAREACGEGRGCGGGE